MDPMNINKHLQLSLFICVHVFVCIYVLSRYIVQCITTDMVLQLSLYGGGGVWPIIEKLLRQIKSMFECY